MLLIAHRGSSGNAPENTLAAFRQAVKDGADMIELDVRLSADGVPVVLHDRRLNRTTGVRGNVRRWTAMDLEALNAGARFGNRFSRECIPRLATVLRMLPPEIGVNVEVKTDGDRRRSGLMRERLAELLRSFPGKRSVLVSSFDHGFLRRFHELLPEIPTGVLYSPVRDVGRSPLRLTRRAGGTIFICSRAQVRKVWIRQAHGADIRVLVYGVETVRQMLSLKDRGIDGVITDYPARLRRALHLNA
jgi:glycerophosphoryl diester phosphodiesterase